MEAHAIARHLADADPANTSFMRSLGVCDQLIGDALTELGDLSTALEHYQTAKVIRERLTENDPTNRTWLNDLLSSHQKVAKSSLQTNDFQAATESYNGALSILNRILSENPRDFQIKRELAWLHNNLGELLLKCDRPDDALEHLRTGITVVEELTATGSTDAVLDEVLSVMQYNIGNIQHFVLKDMQAAFDSFRAVLTARARMFQRDPTNKNWLNIAATLQRVGDAAEGLGDQVAAREYFEGGRNIMSRLMEREPGASGHFKLHEWFESRLEALGPSNH